MDSGRRVLASKEGSLGTTALLARKRKRDAEDVNGAAAAGEKAAKCLRLWVMCRHPPALCRCGLTPCAALKLKRCTTCGKVNDRKCSKKACFAAELELDAAFAAVAGLEAPAADAMVEANMGEFGPCDGMDIEAQ